MKGKYLITTNDWFVAPDGNQYKAAWGEVKILGDDILGVKTNRNSDNWFAQVGRESDHIIIAGCQIFYAIKSEERPSALPSLDWQLTADNYKEHETPSRIYFAE